MALTPGERITLIKKIGVALSSEPQADMDLTLDEFGMPWLDQQFDDWNSQYEYVTLRVRRADDDDKIVALHTHLYPDASTEPSEGGAGPWLDGYFRLFISHTSANKQLAAG